MWNQTEKFFKKQSELIYCLKFMPWDLNKTLPIHTYIYLANRPHSKVKHMPVFLETCIWILFFTWPKFPKVKRLMGWLMCNAWGENKILYFSSRKTPRDLDSRPNAAIISADYLGVPPLLCVCSMTCSGGAGNGTGSDLKPLQTPKSHDSRFNMDKYWQDFCSEKYLNTECKHGSWEFSIILCTVH